LFAWKAIYWRRNESWGACSLLLRSCSQILCVRWHSWVVTKNHQQGKLEERRPIFLVTGWNGRWCVTMWTSCVYAKSQKFLVRKWSLMFFLHSPHFFCDVLTKPCSNHIIPQWSPFFWAFCVEEFIIFSRVYLPFWIFGSVILYG
jgi:hypothetical protein